MFMSASSKIVDEFFCTLGRESNDSKTHWLCFASQKCCELHFKFNDEFKEVAVIFPMPKEFKLQFSRFLKDDHGRVTGEGAKTKSLKMI